MIDKNDRKYTSNLFNDLPFDVREKVCLSEIPRMVNELLIQKNRLKENYNREVKHINERIKFMETEYNRDLNKYKIKKGENK